MLSEALGSFDVNTVCPLPGSWINHVECIFAGFAETRLWECHVFSSKLHALRKSLMFFRSFLLTALANLMFRIYICLYLCGSLRIWCIG